MLKILSPALKEHVSIMKSTLQFKWSVFHIISEVTGQKLFIGFWSDVCKKTNKLEKIASDSQTISNKEITFKWTAMITAGSHNHLTVQNTEK